MVGTLIIVGRRLDWVIFHAVALKVVERFGWWASASWLPDNWISYSLIGIIGLVMPWWRITSWCSRPT